MQENLIDENCLVLEPDSALIEILKESGKNRVGIQIEESVAGIEKAGPLPAGLRFPFVTRLQ